jgi:Protein of unknown function (DUF4065)
MRRVDGDTSTSRTADERTRDVIRSFVSQYRYLHEWRIQKLVFYADLLSLARRGYRLTSAEFRRHHYGVYSEEIHDDLRMMDDLQRTDDVTPTGRPTVRYSMPGSSSTRSLSREDLALIHEAHEATRELKNEELADWGKETSIWRTTTQGEILDFGAYARILGRDSPAIVARYNQIRSSSKAQTARFKSSSEVRASIEDEQRAAK